MERHGPGYSKVVIGDDEVDRWADHLDVLVASVADNSGRSCVNASGIWVTRHADAIAEALAGRLAAIAPRPAEDPEAALAPFVDRGVAERISALIDQGLAEGGARDVSEALRGGPRFVIHNGCPYLLPTVLRIGGDKTLTGDWNSDGIDTIGVLRGNIFYLRNSNTIGYADVYFALGIPGDMPIAGNWDGKP